MHTPVTSPIAPSSHRGLGGRRLAAGRHISGFTIVEVLVSLLILSVGLLGSAKLVLSTAHSNDSAYLRSQATQMAYAILDNMRANPTAAAAAPSNYITTLGAAASSYAGQNCLNTACPVAANLATYDLYTWKTRLASALPGGVGSVTVSATAPVMATIVVQWDDSVAQSIFGGAATGSVTLETALHP
jgi:type IV pilus assembly protein PilV